HSSVAPRGVRLCYLRSSPSASGSLLHAERRQTASFLRSAPAPFTVGDTHRTGDWPADLGPVPRAGRGGPDQSGPAWPRPPRVRQIATAPSCLPAAAGTAHASAGEPLPPVAGCAPAHTRRRTRRPAAGGAAPAWHGTLRFLRELG